MHVKNLFRFKCSFGKQQMMTDNWSPFKSPCACKCTYDRATQLSTELNQLSRVTLAGVYAMCMLMCGKIASLMELGDTHTLYPVLVDILYFRPFVDVVFRMLNHSVVLKFQYFSIYPFDLGESLINGNFFNENSWNHKTLPLTLFFWSKVLWPWL